MQITVLNPVSQLLPFPVSESEALKEPIKEDTRMRNRVLDLRRPAMQSNLRLRHKMMRAIRRFLEDEEDFVEVETPILTRSTPEGARDYLVPSRLTAGEWYALPQSPQLFKQMLMVSGLDRYYQIARCFRDEDLRADRQPEFTQLDLEAAWMDAPALQSLVEQLMQRIFKEVIGVELQLPLQRMTWQEAMDRYGSDKPDLRYGLEHVDVSMHVKDCGFKVFSGAVAEGGCVKAIRVPAGKRVSNSRIKPKGDIANEAVAGGSFWQFLAREVLGLVPSQSPQQASPSGGGKGKGKGQQHQQQQDSSEQQGCQRQSLLWVTDFPMFEYDEEQNRFIAMHHPFTAPHPEDLARPDDTAVSWRAQAYDLVYNGVEIGGGSLRIYRRDVQARVFSLIGLSKEEAEAKFGYLLDCFEVRTFNVVQGFASGTDFSLR
ncbi:tRNA synthetases class II-domain-containing protein [Dunaliella salina]|uniref:tRNA synthetases class II-domain-containing protein n=1 Tax=Dunaliella salina TaxID=3046 RepID=A0ABQ7GWK8_DUNSA|nr:tRNA synthetases class II-domain-containing protein [Dunaliella salina]|eukprot:KAF5838998.1 tRNA synthetases class II-domain-containing protein [Dunaliella salina]